MDERLPVFSQFSQRQSRFFEKGATNAKQNRQEPTEYHSSLGVKAEKRNLAELQKFFEFIENNKQNLFDLCGFRGELE